mgnify:CR=1 FL=1
MRKIGGVLQGPWRDDGEDGLKRRCHALVWGTLTTDPEVKPRKKGGYVVNFRVRLKRGTFLRSFATDEHPCYWILRRMKENEPIVVLGEISTWSYTTAAGEQKVSTDLYPDLIIPGLLLTNPANYMALHGESDPMFGLDAEAQMEPEKAYDPNYDYYMGFGDDGGEG